MLSPEGQDFHRPAHAECWTAELLRWLNHQQPKKKKTLKLAFLQCYKSNRKKPLWFYDTIWSQQQQQQKNQLDGCLYNIKRQLHLYQSIFHCLQRVLRIHCWICNPYILMNIWLKTGLWVTHLRTLSDTKPCNIQHYILDFVRSRMSTRTQRGKAYVWAKRKTPNSMPTCLSVDRNVKKFPK